MSKVADVKLSWKKSVSGDAAKVQVEVINDGETTSTEFGPEVEEMTIVVKASTSCSFKVVTIDAEGNESTSVIYSFSLGDLEAPQPATDLFHEILGVRDV